MQLFFAALNKEPVAEIGHPKPQADAIAPSLGGDGFAGLIDQKNDVAVEDTAIASIAMFETGDPLQPVPKTVAAVFGQQVSFEARVEVSSSQASSLPPALSETPAPTASTEPPALPAQPADKLTNLSNSPVPATPGARKIPAAAQAQKFLLSQPVPVKEEPQKIDIRPARTSATEKRSGSQTGSPIGIERSLPKSTTARPNGAAGPVEVAMSRSSQARVSGDSQAATAPSPPSDPARTQVAQSDDPRVDTARGLDRATEVGHREKASQPRSLPDPAASHASPTAVEKLATGPTTGDKSRPGSDWHPPSNVQWPTQGVDKVAAPRPVAEIARAPVEAVRHHKYSAVSRRSPTNPSLSLPKPMVQFSKPDDVASLAKATIGLSEAAHRDPHLVRDVSPLFQDGPIEIGANDAAVSRRGLEAPVQRAEPLARPVVTQLVQAAKSAVDGMFEVRLAPEELGRVRLAMTAGEAGLTVHVSTERPETLELIRRNIDMLASELQEQGFDDLTFLFSQDSGAEEQASSIETGSETRIDIAEPQLGDDPQNAQISSDGRLDLRL